jgi:hypothetical protein
MTSASVEERAVVFWMAVLAKMAVPPKQITIPVIERCSAIGRRPA